MFLMRNLSFSVLVLLHYKSEHKVMWYLTWILLCGYWDDAACTVCKTGNILYIHIWPSRATNAKESQRYNHKLQRWLSTGFRMCVMQEPADIAVCVHHCSLSPLTFTFTLAYHVLMTLHWLTRNNFTLCSTQMEWNQIGGFFFLAL